MRPHANRVLVIPSVVWPPGRQSPGIQESESKLDIASLTHPFLDLTSLIRPPPRLRNPVPRVVIFPRDLGRNAVTATDSTSLALAAEFPTAARDAWRALVEKALKGVPYENALVTELTDADLQPRGRAVARNDVTSALPSIG